MPLTIVPVTLNVANAFVTLHHRHNYKVVCHQFSIGVESEGNLVGVAIAGLPVARELDDGRTLEIRRVATIEGTRNACSILYGAMRTIGKTMGYRRIITYTLQTESGSSLKAIGCRDPVFIPARSPDDWQSRPGCKSQKVVGEAKWRWELLELTPFCSSSSQKSLWD